MNQYFDENPEVESKPVKVAYSFNGEDYTFITDRGVFSYERIDKATRILLDVLSEKFYGSKPESIVDVGSGYGVIAVCAYDLFKPQKMFAIETNQRALELTRKNATANLGEGVVQAFSPNEFDETLQVDMVISNPPIRIGKEAMFELLRGWSTRLKSGGQMWLVIAKNLGADSTASYLEHQVGLDVKRIASKKGFRVLCCTKK